jgi:hypothetical protein
MLTLKELKTKIVEQVDEVDLIDLLDITTEELVEVFEDKIETNANYIIEQLELDEDDEMAFD